MATTDLSAVLSSMHDPILVLDRELSVVLTNPAFCAMFRIADQDACGRALAALLDRAWDIPELTSLLASVAAGRSEVQGYRIAREFQRIGHKTIVLNARRLDGEHVLVTIEDVGERERLEQALRTSEARLAAVLEHIPVAAGIVDKSGRWTMTNADMRRYVGTHIPSLDAERSARWRARDAAGKPLDRFQFPAARALRGEFAPNVLFSTEVAGETRWMRVGAAPLPDLTGSVEQAICIIEDVTDERRAFDELRRSEERYRILFNSIDQGFCVIEVIFDDAGKAADYRFLEVNDAFVRQTGIPDAVGKRMRELAPNHEEHWFEIYGRIVRNGKPERFERPAGALGRYYDVYAFRIGDAGAHTAGILFNDVSERKRVELERELLTRELSHRVKNTFAVVQALAKQTAYSASSVEQFSDAFLARLHGMARAHSLVLNSRSSDLEALVLQAMEAHRVNSPDRIEIDGVPVSLSTRQVLGLGLALHELATNAAKYGALATRSGIVRVAWQIQTTQKGRQLRLQWRERQGPRVDPPAHSGFGTQLIERVCAYELDGTVEQDYAPEGLTAVISFPLDGEL